MAFIYIIKCKINNKVYVGCTEDINKRWWNHRTYLRNGTHNSKKLQEDWNKYGEDNFEFEVIQECEPKNKYELEEFWINELNSFNEGYNGTFGGKGCKGINFSGENNPMYGKKHSEETKKKMSETHKGKKLSEETKERISESHKGKKHTEESKKRMGEAKKGHNVSKDTRERISEAQKGHKMPDDVKKKLININSKKIVQLSLNNELIKIWDSMVDTEKEGYTKQCVSDCCRGRIKTHKGYKWMYYEEWLKIN